MSPRRHSAAGMCRHLWQVVPGDGRRGSEHRGSSFENRIVDRMLPYLDPSLRCVGGRRRQAASIEAHHTKSSLAEP
jgi:hypothetical protein